MISVFDVMDNVSNSKAVLTGERKTLLSFAERYLAQIEIAERKINQKTSRDFIQRVNEQRKFIDSLISFLQSAENTTDMLSTYISELLEFYEAEIIRGGRICYDVAFWKRQADANIRGKQKIIGAFFQVLNDEQKKELYKIVANE